MEITKTNLGEGCGKVKYQTACGSWSLKYDEYYYCDECYNKLIKTIDIRELLAEIEHIQWAHWTEYMLDNLNDKNIAKWRKQIKTEYKELTEKEKDSDRVWADQVLKAITKHNYKQAFGTLRS